MKDSEENQARVAKMQEQYPAMFLADDQIRKIKRLHKLLTKLNNYSKKENEDVTP